MLPSIKLRRDVTLVEVGPRDGLQNEKRHVSTADKLDLIEKLARSGLARIEATAFVSPKWVPQMADHDVVMRGAIRHPGLRLSALVPNEKGALAAIAAGAQELAIFTSASETFSAKNTNCTIDESLARFVPIIELAHAAGLPLRAYISCACDCPYEGAIDPTAVASLAAKLCQMGDMEIVVSDTIGMATPDRAVRVIAAVLEALAGTTQIAAHFHDTGGKAIENVAVAWDLGIRIFDGSIGGLGGCPYAPGAAGNINTMKLAEYFEGRGISTGVNLEALCEVNAMAQSWQRP
nr:hydroxymethylglutaryl-CoA lyase [uncultured Dongia sp.]